LTHIADKIVKERLQRVSGVGQVTILGGRKRQVNVWVDPVALRGLGMSAVEAFNRLSTEPYLADVPAILLVPPNQPGVTSVAKVDARRQVVQMPMPPDEFRRMVGEILARHA
jgi:multidrug efflux pump subunit AcrB